jgi:hypothetical protein
MHDTSPVFLLTDFGTRDPYAAQMKAVILSRVPYARIIDYTHHVPAFSIIQAGFFLWSGYSYFPEKSVIVCVVDPGVGTDRRIVLTTYANRIVIAPDNGLTGMLLPEDGQGVRAFQISLDPGIASRTFHGRDAFAPLAARVISGEPLERLGDEISPLTLVRSPWADAEKHGQRIRTHVLHVDRFGNCLLGLITEQWQQVVKAQGKMILHPLERVVSPVETYGDLDHGRIGLLAGSQGVYELCLREDDAAKELGLAPEDRVELELVEG